MCILDVTGVTQLHHVLYVAFKDSSVIKTYTADTLSPLSIDIHVEGMRNPTNLVVCRHDRQLYVADYNYCIWRVSPDVHSYTKWLPPSESTTDTFHVWTLSVTSRHLLVTSREPPTVRQYSMTNKQLLCVVELPLYVKVLHHAVETTHGTFVVCHTVRSQHEDEEQYAVSKRFRPPDVGTVYVGRRC